MKKITRKTLLYKSGVEYADYGLNHVEGCSHGCTFPCYAYMMKKRCGIVKTYGEWIQPKIVENALELLNKELPKVKDKINCVFLCFSTDPFMYKQPEVQELTLKILERLSQDGIKSTSVSKGIYPKELTDAKKYGNKNEYGSTIVWESDEYRKRYEPGASPLGKRVEALKYLHDAGLKTWVSIEPYPTPNIAEQDIFKVLEQISFVDKIVFGRWNYNKKISEFKDSKPFYNLTAEQVLEFGRKRNIEIHIKKGTITVDQLTDQKEINKYLENNLIEDLSSNNLFLKETIIHA